MDGYTWFLLARQKHGGRDAIRQMGQNDWSQYSWAIFNSYNRQRIRADFAADLWRALTVVRDAASSGIMMCTATFIISRTCSKTSHARNLSSVELFCQNTYGDTYGRKEIPNDRMS